jgi:hypothetical protein
MLWRLGEGSRPVASPSEGVSAAAWLPNQVALVLRLFLLVAFGIGVGLSSTKPLSDSELTLPPSEESPDRIDYLDTLVLWLR